MDGIMCCACEICSKVPICLIFLGQCRRLRITRICGLFCADCLWVIGTSGCRFFFPSDVFIIYAISIIESLKILIENVLTIEPFFASKRETQRKTPPPPLSSTTTISSCSASKLGVTKIGTP